MTTHVQMLVNASMADEVRLPETRPLTLTRNFAFVVCFCVAALVAAPLMIGWIASVLLT